MEQRRSKSWRGDPAGGPRAGEEIQPAARHSRLAGFLPSCSRRRIEDDEERWSGGAWRLERTPEQGLKTILLRSASQAVELPSLPRAGEGSAIKKKAPAAACGREGGSRGGNAHWSLLVDVVVAGSRCPGPRRLACDPVYRQGDAEGPKETRCSGVRA